MSDPNNNELDLDIIGESESVDAEATESEQEVNGLQLDEESAAQVASKSLSPAEKSALQQEEAWFKKVVEGTKQIEEAPSWLQARLQKKLDSIAKAPDIKDVAREVALQEIARQKEDAQFNQLQESIPALSKTDAEKLKAKFAELRPLGKVKALETAMEILGLTPDRMEEQSIAKARGKMTLPPSGAPSTKSENDILSIAKDQKRWKEFVKNQGSGMIYTEP